MDGDEAGSEAISETTDGVGVGEIEGGAEEGADVSNRVGEGFVCSCKVAWGAGVGINSALITGAGEGEGEDATEGEISFFGDSIFDFLWFWCRKFFWLCFSFAIIKLEDKR